MSPEPRQPASSPEPPRRGGLLRSLGPAIIVASVVLGPGSILASSKVGWRFGFGMGWVVVLAAGLLMAMAAISMRLGIALRGTLCEEIARRAGRPLALAVGVTLFLVAACFQFGNNLGILFALEPFADRLPFLGSTAFPVVVLAGMNAVVIVALFGFRRLYEPLERFMKILVGLMVVGFAANLLFARPSIPAFLRGLVPSLPPGAAETLLPRIEHAADGGAGVADNLWPVQALIGTTFSVGGAFYQAYLVRQKRWREGDVGKGTIDTIAGITTLACLSLMIMATSASVLHGDPAVTRLASAADVAIQLEPLFGLWATGLFCLGIFAGAFSSFLVNAMIGGTALADGLGLGGSMDGRWTRIFTVVALLAGMGVALAVELAGLETGSLIIFAQALTVAGNPLLAASLLWLAARAELAGRRAVPRSLIAAGSIGFLVVLALSIRTGYRLVLQLMA